MSLDGVSVVAERNMVTLRNNLRELGVEVTDLPLSPMNRRIAELVRSRSEYITADGDVLDRFTALANAERAYAHAPDGIIGQTRAVIVWSGGKLSHAYVTQLRQAYLGVAPAVRNDITQSETVARTIAHGILPEHYAQQGLDQEHIHPDAIRDAQRILAQFVGNRINMFVPPDTELIRLTAELNLPARAVPYQVAPQVVTFPNLPAAPYLIVVTIGHGASNGTAWFPPVGGVTPQTVASALPTPQHAALCVPLQCYPQQSVGQWQAVQGWAPNITATSINSLNESDDGEMIAWITGELRNKIADWFYTL